MGLIDAKIMLKCPIDNREIDVKECLECRQFKHISHRGIAKVYVSCKLKTTE